MTQLRDEIADILIEAWQQGYSVGYGEGVMGKPSRDEVGARADLPAEWKRGYREGWADGMKEPAE